MKKLFMTLCCCSSLAIAQETEINEWDDSPCKSLKPSMELANCIAQHHQDIEKKLTQTVKQVQQKLAFDRTIQQHFVKSQKLWQTWIETECAPADPHHHSAHVPVLIAACESNKMRARERHLRQKFALNQNIAQHTVVAGDTLSAIALKNKISVEKLKILNHLRDDKIIVGQILVLAHPVFDLRDDNGVSMQEFGKE
ncbi:LysM peptidoglycan-binding domain-containing protein [Alysiella filiformis]|nr:LysM peptidoglycan-binding domain-containing protein [Alysiella filiformis]QMT31434.1 LysM peptidoglycan-binding domain-containing protein [Alysiella filiformis]UBQ55555.1 LysM peptidoglycan-binding domain-containing protein [Alysiella filiformis DSM 16848]